MWTGPVLSLVLAVGCNTANDSRDDGGIALKEAITRPDEVEKYRADVKACTEERVEFQCKEVCRAFPVDGADAEATLNACDTCCACGFPGCCDRLALWYEREKNVEDEGGEKATDIKLRARALRNAQFIQRAKSYAIGGEQDPKRKCERSTYRVRPTRETQNLLQHCEDVCEDIVDWGGPPCALRCLFNIRYRRVVQKYDSERRKFGH